MFFLSAYFANNFGKVLGGEELSYTGCCQQQQKELKPLPQRGNQRKKLGKQNAPKTKTFKNQQPNTNKSNNKKQKKVK